MDADFQAGLMYVFSFIHVSTREMNIGPTCDLDVSRNIIKCQVIGSYGSGFHDLRIFPEK